MFTVNWSRKDGKRTTTNSKEFNDFQKAVDFLRKRKLTIISDYWAGGYVENAQGIEVYREEETQWIEAT